MSTTPILNLPVAVGLDGQEWVPLVQSGITKRAQTDEIANTITRTINGSIEYILDEGGVPLTTGMKGYLTVPFNAVIKAVQLLGDQTGSIVIDIWKCSFAAFDAGVTAPTVANSIVGGNYPTITVGTKYNNSVLAGWTTGLVANDVLAYNVNSTVGFTKVTISLDVDRIIG